MLKLIRKSIFPLCFSFAVTSCGGPPAYGNKTCDDAGQTVYPTANGTVGVCMPTKDAVYLLCARELGLLSVDTSRETGGAFEAKATDEVQAKADLKLKQSLAIKYAAEGDLASARAAAIRHCITRAGGQAPPPPSVVSVPAASPAAN